MAGLCFRSRQALIESAGDRKSSLATGLGYLLKDRFRLRRLMGREFQAPGKPVRFRGLGFVRTTGDERPACTAPAVGGRRASNTATALAETQLRGSGGQPFRL